MRIGLHEIISIVAVGQNLNGMMVNIQYRKPMETQYTNLHRLSLDCEIE